MTNGSVENCGLGIEMNVPRDPEKCSSAIKVVKTDIAKTLISQGKNCGLRIFQTDWDKKKVTLPIAFIDMPEYDLVLPDSPDGAFRIGMITGQKNGSPEWNFRMFMFMCVLKLYHFYDDIKINQNCII